MKNFYNTKDIYSSLRLRQILNDLKRRPEDAAKELKIKLSTFNKILNGKITLKENLVKKITSKWPIAISDLINPFFDQGPDYKIYRFKDSLKTKRIMQRGNSDYYEYRDTVMTKNSPFKPEWIRQLCYVKNNKPNEKSLKWNRGHLLHQFTYFVGKINFYYIDKFKKKRVAIMNTGDSMYISPYVPHTFASREKKCTGFIIAITYTDKVSTEIQNELLYYGKKEVYELLPKKENNFYSKVSVLKYKKIKSSKFPLKNSSYFKVKKLASSKYSQSTKSFEIEVVENNSYSFQNSSHHYIYILNGEGKIKINKKNIKVKSGDTIYIRPFIKYKFCSKGLKILIVEVAGKISGDIQKQLSQIGRKNLSRIIYDNKQWFKS